MADFTRSDALHYARLQFLQIRDRAMGAADAGTAEYVTGLWSTWDAHLKWLASLGSGIPIREETLESLIRLARRAGNDAIAGEALVDWVDAFPEAVAEMFPPSQSTFTILRDETRATAGRRRPAPKATGAVAPTKETTAVRSATDSFAA